MTFSVEALEAPRSRESPVWLRPTVSLRTLGGQAFVRSLVRIVAALRLGVRICLRFGDLFWSRLLLPSRGITMTQAKLANPVRVEW